MNTYTITTESGEQYRFTGNIFKALPEAARISLEHSCWVHLRNIRTGQGRNIKHKSVTGDEPTQPINPTNP